MSFEIKKNPEQWLICGTGSGWQLLPKETEKTVIVLNDYIHTERYKINADYLCVMDVLDEKPQIVSGINNLGEVIEKINKMKIPLIAPFKYTEIPLSEAFPIKESVKEFGMPYYSNTICYMIAYAMMKGAKEIETYGVNQASSAEYFYEKAGVEYWLGLAVGRGIRVTINGDKSELLTNKTRFGGGILYGYNQSYESIIEAEKKFGEPIVKKLLVPQKPKSRLLREVN